MNADTTTPRIFDCDNHYYEAADAFTRHLPPKMAHRCVQWVEMNGRRYHLIAGKLDRQVANPTFNPIGKPGILRDYFRGKGGGRSAKEMMGSALEPMPAEYMDRDARIARMDEQGLAGAWLFPTAGVLYEAPLKSDVEAICATFRALNRWLLDDWGFNYQGRIFCAPYISLADLDWACEELDFALEHGATVIVMRPAPIRVGATPRSASDPYYDRFWSKVNEAGIVTVAHAGNSSYSTNGYPTSGILDSVGGGGRPTVASLVMERAIYDFLITMVYDRLFERFPNLRVASIENGAQFVPDLMRKLRISRDRLPRYYADDPVDSFREHVWINPFWEDDIAETIEYMGAERVIYGSDWPHVEGLAQPRDILEEIGHIPAEVRARFLHDNTSELNGSRVLVS
jgi:hypothetical protein